MGRIFFSLFALMMLSNFCYASAPEPTQKVILFYNVSDAILQCQNSREDLNAGKEELEKELVNHYGKRFIVQGIERTTGGASLTPTDYFGNVKAGQLPFIVKIDLEGQGTLTTSYQNAFGAKTTGVAPSTNVHLIESIPSTEDDVFYWYDYGVRSYSAGTFAVGRDIYVAQSDPRKNTKNAVRACFRDACKFDDTINKYADPSACEKELNRFTGNLKALAMASKKGNVASTDRVEKFKAWCNATEARKAYWAPLSTATDAKFINSYIDALVTAGFYQE